MQFWALRKKCAQGHFTLVFCITYQANLYVALINGLVTFRICKEIRILNFYSTAVIRNSEEQELIYIVF